MTKKKIASIVGARPQFIKAAPLHEVLNKTFQLISIHTGQHYDKNLSDIFFKEFNLAEPNYNLNIGSGNHGEQSGRMLIEIERVLLKEKPDGVIVYGDTNSTISGALASIKLHIPTIHIEAGMRSFNRHMPEEVNRIATDHLSTMNFCVTEAAKNNLIKEGITKSVYLVGDTMFDVFKKISSLISNKILAQYGLKENNYILTTVHRASNTEDTNKLKAIVNALIKSNRQIVFPVHPRTREYLKNANQLSLLEQAQNIILLKPQGYIENITLMKYSSTILTDSGGMQKEAFFLKKPCITLRTETEWIETLNNNWNTLVNPSNEAEIIKRLQKKIHPGAYHELYGDGTASQKITEILTKEFVDV